MFRPSCPRVPARAVSRRPSSHVLLFPALLAAVALAAGPATSARAARAAGDELTPEAARAKTTLLPSSGSVTVPLDVKSGRPIVEVMVNGKGPYRFFVDTGASHTVIDSSLSAELGLPVLGETHMGDPANPHAIRADRVRIDTLAVGDLKVCGVQAASWNQSAALGGDASFPRGVIGFPVWHDLLLTLDYVDGTLSVRRGALRKGPGTVAFTMPEGIVQMPVRIGGREYQAHLDTGNGDFCVVPAGETTHVRFAGPLAVVGMARTVNSSFLIYGGTLDGALAIAGQTYDRPYLALQGVMPRVNVGGRLLQDYALTFDQRAGLVRFDRKQTTPAPAQPANAGPSGKVAGVGVAPQPDGSLLVAVILPGSAASSKDIQVGDRIVKVDGQDTKDLSDDQRRALMRKSPVTYSILRDGKPLEVTVEF